MRAAVQLADRADRSRVLREARLALADGARWGWVVGLLAAAAVWAARGVPAPRTAAAALLLAPVGVLLAWWRTWRRTVRESTADRRAAAAATARRWATGYAAAAVVIPAGYLATARPLLGVLVALVALAALTEAAILTVPARARARLLRRLRLGAAAVARDESVRVGRALWTGMTLDRVHVSYPPAWAAHTATRRDELAGRLMWDLCGPPPRTPGEAIARPDYTLTWDHSACRVTVQRMPSLPRRVAARAWERPRGAFVLGQTSGEDADRIADGVPLALSRPRAHMLVTGGTQYGKSSSVRAWVVDGLTHGVWPGGVWGIDGKGSGSLAALEGRRGVHAIAHTPDEWARVLVDLVASEVARRYAEMLDWRAGRSSTPPDHRAALLVLDEIQQVLLARPDLAATLDTLARQALESGVVLWVITQRPDAKDAVPGAMRDQLLDRAAFGPLSSAGAKMTFDVAGDDWHRALGVAPIPGRALTWIGGRWRTVQAPWLPIPADVPAVERLYPPHHAPRPRPESGRAAPPPDDAASPDGDGSADAEYDARTARRRRRRT